MSADNGVYILRTPDGNGGYEYRVSHATAIDNIYQKDKRRKNAMLFMYFQNSTVFDNKYDAEREADKQYTRVMRDFGICEYAIQYIDWQEQFPVTTHEHAKQILCW